MSGGRAANGALSPVSFDDNQNPGYGNNDWSPVSPYQSLNGAAGAGGNSDPPALAPPYSPDRLPRGGPGLSNLRGPLSPGLPTPPASHHTSTNSDGIPLHPGMYTGSRGSDMGSRGRPSPPSSVARSSGGMGNYAQRGSGMSNMSEKKQAMMEEALSDHFQLLKVQLGPYLRDEKGNLKPNKARDKLLRLSVVQFQELSTDVFDESRRREDERRRGGPGAPDNSIPKFLPPKGNFHPKRNQARQKLSTLPLERFRQLATDVFYELERRFPHFNGGERPSSPAYSAASSSMSGSRSRGPPSFGGAPPYGRPPPPGGRGYPPNGRGMGGPPSPNAYGRPLPKTFQQNTIVPNKGTLVEDDDDHSDFGEEDDDQDAFGLEGAAARRSNRTTGTADKDLQRKVENLEATLHDKDDELEKLRAEVDTKEQGFGDLQSDLEQRVRDAEDLNENLRTEIEKARSESSSMERDLRSQIDDAMRNGGGGGGGDGEWQQRYQELELDLQEQQRVTTQVREDAQEFLQEMRRLAEQSEEDAQKREKEQQRAMRLEGELEEWKSRYAKAQKKLRSSTMGLSVQSPDIMNYMGADASFTSPDGLVKGFHMKKFQLAIDDLLSKARTAEQETILSSMKSCVMAVRAITSDVDSVNSSAATPISSMNGDQLNGPKSHARLKATVSATANNLITATKNHAGAAGLSPVSLLDAAASHLSTSVVELVRAVKISPSDPNDEEIDEIDNEVKPLRPTKDYSYTNGSVYSGSLGGHVRNKSSVGSGYSRGSSGGAYARGRSTQYSATNGAGGGNFGNGIKNGLRDTRDDLEEFKSYLDDQTALLVSNIQPLIQTVRSPNADAESENNISTYVQNISNVIGETANRTGDAVQEFENREGGKALGKHVPVVMEVLLDCRDALIEMEGDFSGGGRQGMPGTAFRTARAMKELLTRVEKIETGELTELDEVNMHVD